MTDALTALQRIHTRATWLASFAKQLALRDRGQHPPTPEQLEQIATAVCELAGHIVELRKNPNDNPKTAPPEPTNDDPPSSNRSPWQPPFAT